MTAAAKNNTGLRRALLAKVHIAIKELGIDDADYRDILDREFGASSASELNTNQLVELVRYFKSKGWTVKQSRDSRMLSQATALREKAKHMLEDAVLSGRIRNERAFVRKLVGVEDLRWCKDPHKLERLLAALYNVERMRHGTARTGDKS